MKRVLKIKLFTEPKKIALLLFVLLFVGVVKSFSQHSEYVMKAVFFEKFSRFIEWPTELSNPNEPFIVTVLGESPFNNILEDIYSTQKIKNRKVIINYVSKISNIKGTHILFISNSEKTHLADILNYSKDKPILTISDTEGFAKQGVLINYYIEDNKIRFEINETAVKKSGLYISFRLMQTGRIINPVSNN